MLKNASFNSPKWTNLSAGNTLNQQPEHWRLRWLGVGQSLYDAPGDKANGVPECVHKLPTQLPPQQQEGGADALILDGGQDGKVYKAFHFTAAFGAELYQAVTGLKPGTRIVLGVPIRIHQHTKEGDPPPDPWGAESGVWLVSGPVEPTQPLNKLAGGWRNAEGRNFIWYHHAIEGVVPASGEVGVLIRFKSKHDAGVDFFVDSLSMLAEEVIEPEPEPEPEPQPIPTTPLPYRVRIDLAPQDATLAEKQMILAAIHQHKGGFVQSAGDAAYLAAAGAVGSKVVVWGPERWTGGDIVAWLQARGVALVETQPFSPAPGPAPAPVPGGQYRGPALKPLVHGADQPASDWQWPRAKAVFDGTGLAVKFHTGGVNHEWWDSYRHRYFSPVRILLDPTFKGGAAEIYHETVNNVAAFYARGAREFIVLNEPNHEGFKIRWHNGAEFGLIFHDLCRLYMARFPAIRLWFPGLSPGGTGSTPPGQKPQHAFIESAKAVGAFTLVSGVVEHVYTGITGDVEAAAKQMLTEVLDFQQRHALARPLVIGEFSVNVPAPGAYKAHVYKRFFWLLEGVKGVQAAYIYTSSWAGNPDTNQEGMLEHGIASAW